MKTSYYDNLLIHDEKINFNWLHKLFQSMVNRSDLRYKVILSSTEIDFYILATSYFNVIFYLC